MEEWMRDDGHWLSTLVRSTYIFHGSFHVVAIRFALYLVGWINGEWMPTICQVEYFRVLNALNIHISTDHISIGQM